MGSVADRHQWAIERGKEYDANPHQRALLVYIAFRVGPENEGSWSNRDTMTLDTGMHKNTITRALAWWVDRGVLRRTRRQHGSTIYQIPENLTGAMDTPIQEKSEATKINQATSAPKPNSSCLRLIKMLRFMKMNDMLLPPRRHKWGREVTPWCRPFFGALPSF